MTPNPIPSAPISPVTGHNVLMLLADDGLLALAGPLQTYFAAAQAANGDEVKLSLAKGQLALDAVNEAPHLFGEVVGQLASIASYGVSKAVQAVTSRGSLVLPSFFTPLQNSQAVGPSRNVLSGAPNLVGQVGASKSS